MTQIPASVLIVEDDIDLREVIAESLESAGFAAAQAVNATTLTPQSPRNMIARAPFFPIIVSPLRVCFLFEAEIRGGPI